MNRPVRILVASLIGALIAAILLIDAAVFLPRKVSRIGGAVGLLALHVAGRNGFCDASASLGAWDHLLRRGDAIVGRGLPSKNSARMERLTLWQTKSGEFWVPTRDKLGF